jgi:TonB family protein
MKTTTPYFLVGTDAQQRSAVVATAITSLLGWWGIPFGVIFTPYCLFQNLKGGDRRTVESLIQDMENPAKAKSSGRDSYLVLKFIGGAFAIIFALACVMQGYIWLTGKGHKHEVQQRYAPGQSSTQRPARSSETDPGAVYMVDVQRKLKTAWHPPKSKNSERVEVLFKVDQNGHIHNPKVIGAVDPGQKQAALQAIRSSDPLPPLPAVLRPDIDIEFTFDYNVFEGH